MRKASVADHLESMVPTLRAMVTAARKAVRAAAPKAVEIAYQGKPPRSSRAWWKIARYQLGGADVVGISAFSTRCALYFYRGAELDDRSGLLEGGGKGMRFIRLSAPSDAARPEVRRMLRRAFQLPSGEARPKKGDPAIDAYLASASSASRPALRDLRKTIHSLVPGAEECISYRLPAFRYRGRIIAGFSATSTGCSYYPFSGRTLATLAKDIAGYSHTKSALHFTPEEPLPKSLVRKLLTTRIAES